jgi:hypothetical protein
MTTGDGGKRDDQRGFDVGGTFRQLGTAETGNGLQNGLAAVVVGLVAALILYPIARLRRGSAKKSSSGR